MGSVSFDRSELNRLVADLTGLPDEAERRIKTVVKRTAAAVVAKGQAFAPVDTGFLRSSVGSDLDPDGLGAAVGPTADYGRYVEEGTSRMAPHAFMGPALDRQAPGFVAALEQLAGEVL